MITIKLRKMSFGLKIISKNEDDTKNDPSEKDIEDEYKRLKEAQSKFFEKKKFVNFGLKKVYIL
jgi:hypothetical protein